MRIAAATILILTSILLAKAARAENPHIVAIKQEYESLRKQKLRSVELTAGAGGESSEGSQAKVHLHEEEIRLIEEIYFGEMGKAHYSFYYKAGKPFFVLEVRTHYNLPFMQGGPALPKPKSSTVEHRFYIENDKVIRWIDGKKQVPESGKKFIDRSQEVTESAMKAYLGAKEQLKAAESKRNPRP